jgi:hypothetical protein
LPEETPGAAEGEVADFAAKLASFRDALDPLERRLLDNLLLAAATTEDVELPSQGQRDAPSSYVAVASVLALEIVGGTGSAAGHSAPAAEDPGAGADVEPDARGDDRGTDEKHSATGP